MLEEEVNLGLHVAKRVVGTKLPLALGLEVLIKHLPQERARLLQFVLTSLQQRLEGAW
jgi:hypothetical protein